MKKINILLFVLMAFSLVFPPNLMAEVVGTVTCIEGRVDKRAIGTSDYLPVVAGDGISIGDALRTKSYSKAAVSFKDDSVLHIGGASQVEIKEYVVGEERRRKTAEIDLDRGKVRAIVAKTPDLAPFNINTPNAMGTVKGSDIFVSFQQSATNVLVSEGTFNAVHADFPDQMVAVKEGMTTVVPYNAPPEDPRAFMPDEKTKFEETTGSMIQSIEGVDPNAELTKAIVADVSGVVRVEPRGTKRMHAPVKNEVLNTGDKIETGKNGNIKLSFDNGLKIELRPNTQLIITRLTRDPKTGNYDNEFESAYGKLVAQLQNLPSGSSFKVKTPHACCGIRGTIMYLEILPNMTRTFFEGGSGFIDDLINGASTIISEGITFSVDGQGNTSENGTTDEDRSGFGSQFGSDGGNVYGYTGGAPETGGETTGGGDVPGDTTGIGGGTGDNTPFDDVKVELPVENTTPVPTVGITAEMTGKMGAYGSGSFIEDDESSLSGTITAETTSPVWSGQTSAAFTGVFDTPNDRDLFFGDVIGSGDDGGRLIGGIAGTGTENEWAGVFSAIYIDGSGVAGNIFGLFPGTHDMGDTGTFSSLGEMTFIPVTYIGIDLIDSVTYESDQGYFYLGFPENENDISLDLNGGIETMNIEDQNWGIWRAILGGNYSRPQPDENAEKLEWTQFTGDPGPVGKVQYGFKTIEGVDDLESFLRLDVTITFIDHYQIGAFYGTLVGGYEDEDGYYDYEGIGMGGRQYELLTFVSSITSTLNWIGENRSDNSSVNGLFGSSDSLWDDSLKNVLFRGEYYADTEISGSTYLWGSYLKSHDYRQETDTTYDGGAYSGAIAGYIKDTPESSELIGGYVKESAASVFRAIYVSPNPENEVGYFGGKLKGGTYQDINMFEMGGDIDIHQMTYDANEITPETLYDPGVIVTGDIFGYGENDYMSGGIVDSGKTFNLNDAKWGIWGAVFQGEYYSDGVSAWKMPLLGNSTEEDSSYSDAIFIAILSGDNWVANGQGEASFNGLYLSSQGISSGRMSGDVVMNNDGKWVDVDGIQEFQADWSGAGAGEWVEVEDLVDLTAIVSEMQGLMSDLEEINTFTDTMIQNDVYGQITTAAITDIGVYSIGDSDIWAAVFSGTYEGGAQEEWGASFTGVNNASNSIDLQGVSWADNVWSADVTGTINGKEIDEGAAMGTYGDGQFSGIGGGTLLPEEK